MKSERFADGPQRIFDVDGAGTITMKIKSIGRLFHRDEEANLLVIGAIFVMVLVIVLTVVINLAHITHEKIQAQNAADAAALSAGVWQVRGLAFVQSMNNLVYMSDMLSSFGLNLAVMGAAASHLTKAPDPTGICAAIGAGGYVVGYLGLGASIAAHGFSQFILVPLRDVMNTAWPLVSALGASEMAERNGAQSIIGSIITFGHGMIGETVKREIIDPVVDPVKEFIDEANQRIREVNGYLSIAGSLGVTLPEIEKGIPEIPEIPPLIIPPVPVNDWLGDLIMKLPLYALGLELNLSLSGDNSGATTGENAETSGGGLSELKKTVWLADLHLLRKRDSLEKEPFNCWPLVVPDLVIDTQLAFCEPLAGMCGVAKKYFEWAGNFQDELDKAFDLNNDKDNAPKDSGDKESPKEDATDVTKDEDELQGTLGDMVSGAVAEIAENKKWKHPYYVSSRDVRETDHDTMIKLPPSTWLAGCGAKPEDYIRRTSMWKSMGGLGVFKLIDPKTGQTYGQLGSLACASIQVRADAVEKSPKMIRGWVNLVPVDVLEDDTSDEINSPSNSLAIGICH